MTRIFLPTKHANHTNFQRTTADYTDSTDWGAHAARVSVSAACRNTLISNCAEVPPSREPTYAVPRNLSHGLTPTKHGSEKHPWPSVAESCLKFLTECTEFINTT